MKQRSYIPWILTAFLIAGLLGIGAWLDFPILSAIQERSCKSAYTYINADAACGDPDVIAKTSYALTEAKLISLIDTKKKEGRASQVSVYFRDLIHGPVFGINANEEFIPASLLKLPLAVVFFQLAENDAKLFTQPIRYTGAVDSGSQWVRPKESFDSNKTYSVEELLRLMIVYSDNAAYSALEGFLSQNPDLLKERFQIFQELGFINPLNYSQHSVNARGYATVFRLLYNSSYLSPQSSEKLLLLLSEADYSGGIVAGVPKEIAVSHKFGERESEDGTRQLHDCGIVYYPENPYVLCIMTQGTEYSELQEIISTISGVIYKEVDSRRI